MPAFRAASRRLAPASTSISFFSLTNVTLGMSGGPSQGAGDQYQATAPAAGRSPALYEPPPPRATRPPATIRGAKARRAGGVSPLFVVQQGTDVPRSPGPAEGHGH